MRPSTGRLALAAAVAVPVVLLADGEGLPRQLLLGAAMGAFLWALVRRSGVPGLHVACAMVIATAMEMAGSLGWGLYTYRYAAIPFYVPFGHGVFYTLAVAASRDGRLVRRSREVVTGVLAAGSAYAVASLLLLGDASGMVMWVLALGLMRLAPSPLLLSACCICTVALEWVGTTIGNWAWAPVVPGLGLASANPPSGVAVCYVLLDILTVAATGAVLPRLLSGRRPTSPASALPALPVQA